MSNNENETIGTQTEMQNAIESFESLLTPEEETQEQTEAPENEVAEDLVEEVETEANEDPEMELQETEEETEFDEDKSEEDEIETDDEQELISLTCLLYTSPGPRDLST